MEIAPIARDERGQAALARLASYQTFQRQSKTWPQNDGIVNGNVTNLQRRGYANAVMRCATGC